MNPAAILAFLSLLLPMNAATEGISYADDIQNRILNPTCVGCHGKFGVSVRNVNLTSYASIVEHEHLVIPEEPEASLLFRKTSSGHGGLSKSEISDLYTWILEGADEN